MTAAETSQHHRAFVRLMAATSPQAAFAEADKMGVVESVNAEKIEWIKLALEIEKLLRK